MRLFVFCFFLFPSLFAADCMSRVSAIWRNPSEIQITWLSLAEDCPTDHFLVFVESYQVGEDGRLDWFRPARMVATIQAEARVPSLSFTLDQVELDATHLVRVQGVGADGRVFPPSDWRKVAPYQRPEPLDHAIKNAQMTITTEAPPDAPPIPKAAKPARKPVGEPAAAPAMPAAEPASQGPRVVVKPPVREPVAGPAPAPAAARPAPSREPAPAREIVREPVLASAAALPSPCGSKRRDGIEGRVLDSQGLPVAGIKVELNYKFRGQPPLKEFATTDAAGRYCFPGLSRYVRYRISLVDHETRPKRLKFTFEDRHIDDADLRMQ
jgi:hypothetical protein